MRVKIIAKNREELPKGFGCKFTADATIDGVYRYAIIPVSQEDFDRFRIGDEVALEVCTIAYNPDINKPSTEPYPEVHHAE